MCSARQRWATARRDNVGVQIIQTVHDLLQRKFIENRHCGELASNLPDACAACEGFDFPSSEQAYDENK